ncbi:MAG: LysR substrate-binding domain-containing protein, partial [Pseudomonadota bacterium]
SHFWLLPRLPSFRALYPNVSLKVLSQDQPLNLAHDDADVLIRYGRGPFADGVELAHLAEEVFPVASPDYADRHDCAAARPESLHQLTLIEANDDQSMWMTWPEWFERVGHGEVPRQRMLVFNHYSDGVYAAITGQGVVLGWKQLLERPLADGRLVRIGQSAVSPGEGHSLVVADNQPVKPATRLFANWLEASFNEDLGA